MLKRLIKKPMEKSLKPIIPIVRNTDTFTIPTSDYGEVMHSIVTKAQEIKSHCEDFYIKDVPLSELRAYNTGGDTSITFVPEGCDEYTSWGITLHAESQILSKLGYPANFYHKLMESRNVEDNKLATHIFNDLSSRYDGNLFIRTYKDVIRGVLSQKYSCFDSDGITEVLADTLDKKWGQDIKIRGYYNNYEQFHLRFTSTQAVKGLDDKDLFLGMQITSSDVGKSVLSVKFIVYKQVCTNGLCIPTFNSMLFRHKHIGISSYKFREGVIYSIEQFPKLVEEVAPMLEQASKVKANSQLFNAEEDNKLREHIRSYLNLSQKDMAYMTDLAINKYPRTVWGYTNAITEYAQRFSVDRRLELEELAGDMFVHYSRFGISA